MSLINSLHISGSAMSANSIALSAYSSNLANADSVSGNENEAYKSRQPVFAANLANVSRDFDDSGFASSAAVPVQVAGIVEKAAPALKEYNPGHPNADSDGYVYRPNVNYIEEMTNVMNASRSYQINANVADTLKNLAMQTLKVSARG